MTHALVDNAANPEQVAKGKQKERNREDHRRNLVAGQLATYQGREFVWGEIERHDIFARVSGGSAELVYGFLGKRDAGLELLVEVQEQHPEQYAVMLGEAMARAKREQVEIASAKAPKANMT